MKLFRLATVVALPLFLASCLLSPGRFTASLDIRKDRSFTFAYQGEVILLDPSDGISSGMDKALGGAEGKQSPDEPATPPADSEATGNLAAPSEPSAQMVNQRKAVLEALSKEAGYRLVEPIEGNKFRVDYQVSGKLDRNFAYPLNIDAMAVIPWIVIELRKDNTARMMALAFGDSNNASASAVMPGGKPQIGATEREGTFTLTTDATLVMQNNEAGTAPGPGTKVVWKITPTTKAVPTAVVRF
jgi:hypothetical protein